MRLPLCLATLVLLMLPAQAQYSYSRTSGPLGRNSTNEKSVVPAFPGTLRGVSAKNLSLETAGENKMVFHLLRKTVFLDGAKKLTWRDFAEGDLVIVEGRKAPDGSMEAVAVHRQKPPENEKP